MRSIALLALVGAVACKRASNDHPSTGAAGAPTSALATATRSTCTGPIATLALPGVSAVSGAALARGNVWLAATRASRPPVHGVVRVSADLTASEFIELGPALGDQPPPEVVASGDDLAATTYGGKPPRRLSVFAIPPSGAPTALAFFLVDEDESYGFGSAARRGGLVTVWDGERDRRGAIFARRTEFAQGVGDSGTHREDAPVEISDPGENAASPEIVATERGFFAAWITERPASSAIADGGATAVEAPAETAVYRGLAGIHLDDAGNPVGGRVRFGAPEGQVVSFSLAARGAEVVVLSVDRRVRAASAATRLLRYAVSADPGAALKDAAEEEVSKSNVGGGGATTFASFSYFVDDRDHAMLFAGGASRREPLLDESTPLLQVGDILYTVRAGPRDAGGAELMVQTVRCPSTL